MVFEPNQGENHADRYQAAQPQTEGQALENDRDDLYVAVTPAGGDLIPLQLVNPRPAGDHHFRPLRCRGITLAEARERLGEAKNMIAAGKSPAKEKARAPPA